MTRRQLLSALFGAAVPVKHVTAAEGGFIVSGLVTATDTDRAEGFIALGNSVAVAVRDQPIYDRQLVPLIGKVCELRLFPED